MTSKRTIIFSKFMLNWFKHNRAPSSAWSMLLNALVIINDAVFWNLQCLVYMMTYIRSATRLKLHWLGKGEQLTHIPIWLYVAWGPISCLFSSCKNKVQLSFSLRIPQYSFSSLNGGRGLNRGIWLMRRGLTWLHLAFLEWKKDTYVSSQRGRAPLLMGLRLDHCLTR